MSDKITFLQQKAENFRQFLLGQNPDSTLIAHIEGFKQETLMDTLKNVLLPGLVLKGSSAIADEIIQHLKSDDPAQTKAKIERYFDCFQQTLFH